MPKPSLSSALQRVEAAEQTLIGKKPEDYSEAEIKSAARDLKGAMAEVVEVGAVRTDLPGLKPLGERLDALCERLDAVLFRIAEDRGDDAN